MTAQGVLFFFFVCLCAIDDIKGGGGRGVKLSPCGSRIFLTDSVVSSVGVVLVVCRD